MPRNAQVMIINMTLNGGSTIIDQGHDLDPAPEAVIIKEQGEFIPCLCQ